MSDPIETAREALEADLKLARCEIEKTNPEEFGSPAVMERSVRAVKAITRALATLNATPAASSAGEASRVTVQAYNEAYDQAEDALGGAFKDGFREGWIFAQAPDGSNYEEVSEHYGRAVDIEPSEAWDGYRGTYFAKLPLTKLPTIGEVATPHPSAGAPSREAELREKLTEIRSYFHGVLRDKVDEALALLSTRPAAKAEDGEIVANGALRVTITVSKYTHPPEVHILAGTPPHDPMHASMLRQAIQALSEELHEVDGTYLEAPVPLSAMGEGWPVRGLRLESRSTGGAGSHLLVFAEYADGSEQEIIRSYTDGDTSIYHWAQVPQDEKFHPITIPAPPAPQAEGGEG